MSAVPAAPSRPARIRGLLAGLVLAAGLSLAPRDCLADKVHDSDEHNYFLKIPDEWSWGRPADFAKYGVVEVADRRLALLADGKTEGTGQGARVMLSVQDVPKDFEADYETWLYNWQVLETKADQPDPETGEATVSEELAKAIAEARDKLEKPLLSLANKPDIQSILLARFEKDPKKQPHMEPDARGVQIGRIPAAELKFEGTCANLDGVDAPCEARMYVWVVRKRLYRMAFWVWINKYDRERLRDDVDGIQFNYETPKPTAIPKKLPDPTKADPGAPAGPVDAELAKEYLHTDLAFQFAIWKALKFKPFALDRTKADQKRLGYREDGILGASSCIIELLVYPVKNATEPFSIDQYLTDFWSVFLKTHPNGKLETAPFPNVLPKSPYLSLPELDKKKAIDRPEKKKDGKEEKYSRSDIEKTGCITEYKGISIGTVKVKNTWRICLMGNAERAGDEINVQYIFQTPDYCYVLRIVSRRDGLTPLKDGVAKILAQFKLIEPK